MTNPVKPKNPTKAWLSEFLLTRGQFSGPTGNPLYSYQLDQDEFERLRAVLTNNKQDVGHPTRRDSWSACCCLYISESYRRDYDGGSGSWSWDPFEKRLCNPLNPGQRMGVVERGLAYWKRPIRQRQRGRDLLGSLFAEGGLPWKLVQSDSHGFGRAVRGGLKQFYRLTSLGRTTTDLMGDYDLYIPMTFRNLETRQLLAGIVEQLMHLVEAHPLSGNTDPAAYLDDNVPEWRSSFPIPLGEENGRNLVNEWLRDAEQHRYERKKAVQKALEFTSQHSLEGELSNWYIKTLLFLPKQYAIDIDTTQLTGTRLELGFFEGDSLLAKGGAVYGSLEGTQLTVRFPKTEISIQRRQPEQVVSLKLLEGGAVVHSFSFDGSALEYQEQPLVFEQQDETWVFVASASCTVQGGKARIRLPANYRYDDQATTLLLADSEAEWLDVNEELCVQSETDLYRIRFGAVRDDDSRPFLRGVTSRYASLPHTVYKGWPSLVLPESSGLSISEIKQYANGNILSDVGRRGTYGVIQYSVKNQLGETILQRRFGVVPEGMVLSLLPASAKIPARLIVKGSASLDLKVGCNGAVVSSRSQQGEKQQLELEPTSDEKPQDLTLYVSGGADLKPVEFKLPYPDEGARLFNSEGILVRETELYLNDLMGLRLSLTNGGRAQQKFFLQIALARSASKQVKRSYTLTVESEPVVVSLFAYLDDITQMLAAEPEQDAFVTFTVDSQRPLMNLKIRRYNGQLEWESKQVFSVNNTQGTYPEAIHVAAMLLSDPKREPLQLVEETTQGVGVGRFKTTVHMDKQGPWLIYPEPESACQFRPQLYSPTQAETEVVLDDIHSLHRATEVYHPHHAPDVINQQIAAMGRDLSHSGWQYLDDLRSNFDHLPLSTFESWRALAEHPSTLAMSVFRLEINEAFCARIRDELAVIWEMVPLPQWVSAFALYRKWLAESGLPGSLVDSIVKNRLLVLPAVVPGFEFLGDYFETGDCSQLQAAPIEMVLPAWYLSMRQDFVDETQWPSTMGGLLRDWVSRQDLPDAIKSLSLIEETNAVAYLPIYMAHITAGMATFTELEASAPLQKFSIRLISDFEQQGWYRPVHSMMVSYLLAQGR